MLGCPICAALPWENGTGCDYCDDRVRGQIVLTRCPFEYAGREPQEMIRMARFYRRGLPPVVGGVLDQSNWFASACEFVWSEQAVWRKRLKLPGAD